MTPTIWIAIGFAGQCVFGSRFVVQWISSERQQQSVFPVYFWYASLVGAMLLLAYAIHLGDPVFIAGESFGSIVYIRNLMLRRNREQ
jgi:lipid-A-disaccharide synthase-like uncharacterized protein